MSWVQKYSWADIKTAQHKDPALKFIIWWLATQEEPGEDELMLSTPAVKHCWLTKELFSSDDDGVLWRRNAEKLDQKLLVVPIYLQNKNLELLS